MELPQALKAWDRFWFSPIDPRALAAMRISLGLLLLSWWTAMGAALPLLHIDGPFDTYLMDTYWTPWRVTLLEGLSPEQLRWVWLGGFAVLGAFTAGLGTRLANLLTLVLLVAVWHRSPWIHNGGDRLLRIWTLTLLLSPSGAIWSVDAWIRGRLGAAPIEQVPILAVRLVQIQLVVMYTATGLEKLLGGPEWLAGPAVYFAISDGGFSRAPWLFDPLLQTWAGQALAALSTWITLVFEVAFLPGVLWRRTRWLTLGIGAAMHLGILVTLSVGVFGPASVWGYQTFGPWSRPRSGGKDQHD